MKFKNQYTGKEYDSFKECEDSEKEYLATKAELEKKAEQAKVTASKRKKELSDRIEAADKAREEALKLYDVAKEKAKEIVNKAQKEAEEVLSVALKDVSKASEDKMNALREFTKEFGPYKVTYTGSKAVDEFNRWTKGLETFWDWFWKL